MKVIHDFCPPCEQGAVLDIATGPSVTIWNGREWIPAKPEGQRGIVPYEPVAEGKIEGWLKKCKSRLDKKRGVLVIVGVPHFVPPTVEEDKAWQESIKDLPKFARAFLSKIEPSRHAGTFGLYHDMRYQIYKDWYEGVCPVKPWTNVPTEIQ